MFKNYKLRRLKQMNSLMEPHCYIFPQQNYSTRINGLIITHPDAASLNHLLKIGQFPHLVDLKRIAIRV